MELKRTLSAYKNECAVSAPRVRSLGPASAQ